MRSLKKILFSFLFFYHFQCLTDSFVPVETIENIVTCWEGDEGIQLHHENGVKTEQLVPPHEYVPWVTFNDVSYCNEKIRQNVRMFSFNHKNFLSNNLVQLILQEHSEDDTSMYCQDDLCRCLCEDYLSDVPECQGDILDFCIFSKDN